MPPKPVIYRTLDEVTYFVLRRAVRYGSVTRRDLLDAFAKLGTTKASLAMDLAAAIWPDALERTGKAVRVREHPTIMRCMRTPTRTGGSTKNCPGILKTSPTRRRTKFTALPT